MAKKSEFDQKKALKKNVIDDVTYTKTQKVIGWLGLAIGLWGVFFSMVAILFCMTQGLWGTSYDVSFTDPLHTILNK